MKVHKKVSYHLTLQMVEKQVLFYSFSLDFMLTVTTIMKTVIGAGIISLPSTISKLGYVFGLLVYLLVVGINQFTSVMLLKGKNLARHSNYSSIMCHLFNSNAAKAISSAIILFNNLGICIVELTIFK